LARSVVKNEIEMVREGIEGSFHTEAIFLMKHKRVSVESHRRNVWRKPAHKIFKMSNTLHVWIFSSLIKNIAVM